MGYFAMLKNWWTVVKPNKKLFIFQILTATIANALHTITTIPAAKVITSLTEYNFTSAYIWLAVGFGLLLLRNVFWHINYKLFPMQLRHVYLNAQRKILNKVFSADDKSLKLQSKERIINTIASNVYNCGEFADFLSYKLAYLFRAVITLIIVLSTNLLIGSIIILITVVVFVVLRVIYRKLGATTNEVASNKDAIFEGFSDIVDNRIISNDLNINEMLQKDYETRSESLMGSYAKKLKLNSYKDNWVFVLWNAIVMFATIYLVSLMDSGVLTLTMYLIITPYLTSTIEYFVAFFNVFSDLENVNVSAMRVSAIYSMTDKELIEFGKNTTDKINGRVQFYDVTYDPHKKHEGCSTIKNISLVINEGQIALIQGQRQSGKRTLFYLMRRTIKPESGMITIGDINIYDYERKSYVHNLGYVTSSPYFFNSSIMGNLKYVEPSERKVEKTCKDLNIYDAISALPNGFNTNMTSESSTISEYLLFMIGLARVILTKCEVIMVYEFPRLGGDEQAAIMEQIVRIKKDKAIIIFSANSSAKDIADLHYVMERGKLTEVTKKLKEDNK